MRSLSICVAFLFISTACAFASDCNLAASDAASAGARCGRAWMDHNLHLNDIVTVGTHNSYKLAIPERIMALIRFGARKSAQSLDYAHTSLSDQLNAGARAIEIDVVYDPKGGLYAHPAGAAMTGVPVTADYVATMSIPGFKVLHVQDIDYRSVCETFVACLSELKAWSSVHRDHVPILVTLNAKDDEIAFPGSVTPLKFDTAAFDALDGEIQSVFSRGDIVTPDEVQAGYPTLRQAVLEHGWPTLGATRGRFVFALDEEGVKLEAYRGGRKSLEGRMMFINAPADSPVAAYLTLNEPLTDATRITDYVKLGYLVRTRADADTFEARSNDTARRDKALSSGAQYVSTDYMQPDPRFGPYRVQVPQGFIAACNPQRNPERCAGLPVELAQ